jgi:hypothetical protein
VDFLLDLMRLEFATSRIKDQYLFASVSQSRGSSGGRRHNVIREWQWVAQFKSAAPRIAFQNEESYFFESSPLKWLSTSSRLSGFLALVNTTE